MIDQAKHKRHVLAYCKQRGYTVLRPTREDRTIIVYNNAAPCSMIIAEAASWSAISIALADADPYR